MNHSEHGATMSVEQAGDLLGISRRSAYRAANAGHIPSIRLGRRILVPTARVYAMLGLKTRDTEQTLEAPGEGGAQMDDRMS